MYQSCDSTAKAKDLRTEPPALGSGGVGSGHSTLTFRLLTTSGSAPEHVGLAPAFTHASKQGNCQTPQGGPAAALGAEGTPERRLRLPCVWGPHADVGVTTQAFVWTSPRDERGQPGQHRAPGPGGRESRGSCGPHAGAMVDGWRKTPRPPELPSAPGPRDNRSAEGAWSQPRPPGSPRGPACEGGQACTWPGQRTGSAPSPALRGGPLVPAVGARRLTAHTEAARAGQRRAGTRAMGPRWAAGPRPAASDRAGTQTETVCQGWHRDTTPGVMLWRPERVPHRNKFGTRTSQSSLWSPALPVPRGARSPRGDSGRGDGGEEGTHRAQHPPFSAVAELLVQVLLCHEAT